MTVWWHIAEIADPATPKWSAANYSNIAIKGLIEKVSGVSSANPVDRCFTTVGSNTLVGGTLGNRNDLVVVHPYHFCCTDVAIAAGPTGIMHRSGNSIAGGSWSYLPNSLTASPVTFGTTSSSDCTGGGSSYSMTIYNGSAWVCQGGGGISNVNPNVSSFCSGSGTSGGTYACYEPVTGSAWKKAICILSSYYNATSTGQTCGPYSTAFTSDSSMTVTKNLSQPLTTTHTIITFPSSMPIAESGVVIIEGN
jgi:hypothetical protein